MICPYCETENRDERDACYHCGKDLSMLRLIVNKAKHHYNLALEHAERGRNSEAITELRNALDLDSRNIDAHVVLGSLLAREEQFDQAQEAWEKALQLTPPLEKAHAYLGKSEALERTMPVVHFYRRLAVLLILLVLAAAAWIGWEARPNPGQGMMLEALSAFENGNWGQAQEELDTILGREDLDSRVRQPARALSTIIYASIQQRLDQARIALRTGDYTAAYDQLELLAARNLGEDESQEVNQIFQTIDEQARDQIEQALRVYLETGEGLPRLQFRLERIEEAQDRGYLGGIDLEGMRTQIAQGRQTQQSGDFVMIRAQWAGDRNDMLALAATYALIESTPGEPPAEVAEFYEMLLERVRQNILSEAETLVAQGQAAEARALVESQLRDIYPETLREEVKEGLPPTDALVQEQETQAYLEQLKDLAAAGDFEGFLSAAREMDDYQLPAAAVEDIQTSATAYRQRLAMGDIERGAALVDSQEWAAAIDALEPLLGLDLEDEQARRVEELLSQARASVAQGLLEDVLRLDPQFDNPPGRNVPNELAAQVLEHWEALRAQVSEGASYRHRQLEFYRAASAYITGDYALARRLFEEFLEEYEGDYTRNARRYLDLIEEERD